MPPVINLMALVIFATSLFTRSLDPVIPQIAGDMKVDVTTAALLATVGDVARHMRIAAKWAPGYLRKRARKLAEAAEAESGGAE